MIEPAVFVHMIRKRLTEERETHLERMKSGVKRKEYHTLCGRIAQIDNLDALIEDVITTNFEDDDEVDDLTKPKRENAHGTKHR